MKNLDWGKLTDDLLEAMVTNQQNLAKLCKVTQQSVSNWKTGSRKPGVYARNQLRELAQKNNLSIEDYKKESVDTQFSPEDINEKILNLAVKIYRMPENHQKKIIEMTEFLAEK